MMSEEEIRKELAMGNIVCPECSDSLMNFEYDENDNCIYVCPKCGYDIEAENYDYFFESELYNNDEYEDEPELAQYIVRGVTEGLSYDLIKVKMDIPCCKDVYYSAYRRFFWILNKERD